MNCTKLILPLLASLMLVSCTEKQAEKEKKETSYALHTVALSDRTLLADYTATIKGCQTVEIRPQVSGMITDIRINEGSMVDMGQVLFVIDPVPYEAAYEIAVANVKSAEAALSTAQLLFLDELGHLGRSQKLRGIGGDLTAGEDVQILDTAVSVVEILVTAKTCQNVAETVYLVIQVEHPMLNGATEVGIHQKDSLVHLGKGHSHVGHDQGFTRADVSRGDTVNSALLTLGGVAQVGTQELERLSDGEGGLLIQNTAIIVTVGHEVSALGFLTALCTLE